MYYYLDIFAEIEQPYLKNESVAMWIVQLLTVLSKGRDFVYHLKFLTAE